MPEIRIREGQSVRFQFGARRVDGIVKEDRGPIGVEGRRLYLVEFGSAPPVDEIERIELPAEDLEPVEPSAAQRTRRKRK